MAAVAAAGGLLGGLVGCLVGLFLSFQRRHQILLIVLCNPKQKCTKRGEEGRKRDPNRRSREYFSLFTVNQLIVHGQPCRLFTGGVIF